MASLLKTVKEIWRDDATLCALIPWSRVFTGRIPSTELYAMPFVSISATAGRGTRRSDKSRLSHGPLSFSIWVDDAQLEFGEKVADAITDAYADRCWPLSARAQVFDVLDEGEPSAHQTDLPNIKAWEVVKLFTVCIERQRVDRSAECCVQSSGSESTSGEGSSSSSTSGSSSSQSSST